MYTTPELANLLQFERDRQIADARLARLAACARACAQAPATLIERIVRLVRPAPVAC
jgi:hypothetical protein